MTNDDEDPRRAIRRLNVIGFTATALFVGGFSAWAAVAQLQGAVIAAGEFVVESNTKKVQHPNGGVVGQILVKEGSEVSEGQVLIRLDDTVARSTVGVLRAQIDELEAREGRLYAERDDAETIEFPPDLAGRKTEASLAASMAGEARLFESRRTSRTGQRKQLEERVGQSNEEIRGLSAQLAAKESELKFVGEELASVITLYKQNLVTIVRMTQLQRDQARLEGERGQLIAEIARARAKISETELQILQLDRDFRTEVLKDLRESQGKLAELKEKITAAQDQLNRIEIRSPQTGIVQHLSVHTIGGVISNNDVIMEIVPMGDDLVVEAKITPSEIDRIAVGDATSLHIMAGNQRTTPNVKGVLTYIASDLTKDKQTNASYYVVRAALSKDEIRRLDGLKLIPGMPVEVFIETQEHTPLQYLLKPLREQVARTFRER
jgi:HlyD family secretion protein